MRIINKIVFAFVMVMALGSCKKVLDVKPSDLIPAESAVQTMTDLQQAVNGVYATWQPRRPVYVSALISDEVRLGTGSEYRNVGNILFNWSHVSDSQDWRDDETGGIFTNMYAVIDRANRVLTFIPGVPTTTTAEATLKEQYRGEMLALRALAHLELLRNFSATATYQPGQAGVVVQKDYVRPEQVASYRPSRNTQGEVMTQIIADLDAARPLIPTTFTSISRITRNAVIGGMARAALWRRDWQTVIDRSTEIIAAQPLTPRAGYAALWSTRTLAENQNTEIIWKLNMSATDAANGKTIGNLFQDVGAGAAVQATPAQKLLNTYDQANDIRWTSFFTLQGGRRLISKYGLNTGANAENFQYDVKMMRTSEFVLARAEAYAELNMITEANADLSALRTARIAGYVHVPIIDPALLINAILTERYKELPYEGHRYYDLRRRGLPIQRDISDVVNNTAIQTLQPTDSKYLLPIPQQEVTANPNYGQNPGY